MNKLLLLICITSFSAFSKDVSLESIFSKSPVEGTIVVENLDGSEKYVFNPDRAKTKLAVASTFKIPNTLIGVEENIVSSESSVFPWDGKQYDIQAWNHDQTLASAFQVSCVWCYQEIAKKVGAEKYKTYVKAIHYGHLPNTFDLTQFWLDGTLKLNAYEQVAFLKQLYHQKLPFSTKSFNVLKEVMLAEKTENYSMYAKSGWARRVKNPVGWYVGYLETKNGTWFFATNLAIKDVKQLNLRKEISMEVLEKIGVISSAFEKI
ncbi:class D beta-lactamase [Vibrio mangrovi]|uniref:beta-lactamase n=1 Tax=Vibrio mangrovi TaxID=474394 RepID=A0A1Y6IY45_9VIBR|nr:class D beta-lactamase [Vibrio mangrovi]MDW6002526.1 class D beta-lactamase [Vibrio mangrovi]SMS01941.1 Beta-lactamase OXA-2 precursor [Vibrio mangrovi]